MESLIAFWLTSKLCMPFHTGLYPLHSLDVRTLSQAEKVVMPIGGCADSIEWILLYTRDVAGQETACADPAHTNLGIYLAAHT